MRVPLCADAIGPSRDIEAARLTEIEEQRPGVVQQREDPQRPVGGDQVEIGHAAPEQRVSLAEVIVNAKTRHLRGQSFMRLIHAEELGHDVAQGLRAVVRAAKGTPVHIVRLTLFVTNKLEYVEAIREVGPRYRALMGKHFPAMTLVEVKDLLEPGAKVEIEATAVIP